MERRRCLRSLSRDNGFGPDGRFEHSPIAKGFEPKAGGHDPSPRCQMLIDGLHEAAAALDNLAEGRPSNPIGMVIHTEEPKGLWLEHTPELHVLFEAPTTLETVTTAGNVVEVDSPIRQRPRQVAKSLRALAGEARIGAPDRTRAS
jgi:hypothetical protein